MPLSGLSIAAVGERVIVKEGASRWQAESGQYLLAFEGDPDGGSLSIMERGDRAPPGTPSEPSALEWFDRGAALETKDAGAAIRAYEQAVAADPALVRARINLGGLLHESGRHAEPSACTAMRSRRAIPTPSCSTTWACCSKT
jgi:hypothetical protein